MSQPDERDSSLKGRVEEMFNQDRRVIVGDEEAILKEKLYTEQERSNALAIQVEELRSRIQDREERKKYAAKIFQLVYAFIAATIFLTWLNGVRTFYVKLPDDFKVFGFSATIDFTFHLDNAVMGWLLTTSSANVIAIFVFVVKYLFPIRANGPSTTGS